jgi:hypothetical protein
MPWLGSAVTPVTRPIADAVNTGPKQLIGTDEKRFTGDHPPEDRRDSHLRATQVHALKRDILKIVRIQSFLLTYVEKPIIINSFHRVRGAFDWRARLLFVW